MKKVTEQSEAIVAQLTLDLEEGTRGAHILAFTRLANLSFQRLKVWLKLISFKRNRCELCSRRVEHEHTIPTFTATKVKVKTYKELQTALNAEFGDVYRVSSPKFGQTINVTAKDSARAEKIEVRAFISRVCGLPLLNGKGEKRKVLAVVKIPQKKFLTRPF